MSLQTVKTQEKYGLINNKVEKKIMGSFDKKKSSVFLSEDDLLENDDNDEDNKFVSLYKNNRKEISKVNNHLINKPDISKRSSDDKLLDIESNVYDYDGQYDLFKDQQEQERQIQMSQLNSQSTSVAVGFNLSLRKFLIVN